METPAIVLAQPLFLLFAKHVFQHHARLDRHARQPLEAVPAFVRVGVLGLYAAYDENGLDANAKFVRFVYCFDIQYQRGWREVEESFDSQ